MTMILWETDVSWNISVHFLPVFKNILEIWENIYKEQILKNRK